MRRVCRSLGQGRQLPSHFRFINTRAMDNIRTQTDTELKPPSSSESASVTFHEGLTFRAFEMQTGYVNPYSLYRLMMHGRLSCQPEPCSLIDYPKLSRNTFLFVVSGNFIIPGPVYNTTIPKYPATVQTNLVTFKRSSLVLETSLVLLNLTQKVTIATGLVVVSKETRKPAALPDWWKEKYRRFYSSESVQYLRAFDRPVHLQCRGVESKPYSLVAPRRDMDYYGHVNASNYIQYCLDALEHHLLTNQIDCAINTVSLLIKQARYLHRGESVCGDMLNVAFWDDETDPETVAFDISKSGKSIYQAKIQFHDKSVLGSRKSKL